MTAESISEIETQLTSFLALNPMCSISEDGNKIKMPWGDSSLELIIGNIEKTAPLLNNLFLPERYSAIWHRDTKNLEIIYTAYPLKGKFECIKNRGFSFHYKKKHYKCQFNTSSEQLLEVARLAKPITASDTSWRNLISFNQYNQNQAAKSDGAPIPFESISEPISFWIENIEWEEDIVLDLMEQLNFYMSYFDIHSPEIIIHSPRLENHKLQPPKRYRIDKFPKEIRAHSLDLNMLHYWKASREGDPARRFLYSYRIIEYAAAFYLDKKIKSSIHRILSSPYALDDSIKTTEQVLTELMENNMHDTQKIDGVIKDAVTLNILWEEISRNADTFCTSISFDGGFSIEPLIKKGWNQEDFATSGIFTFSKIIRCIRNALSHGMDQKTTKVITPTTHNFQRLQPWTSLISVAAGEVMIYKDFI